MISTEPGTEAPKSRTKRRRRKQNADGTMPLIEHVYELRRRLLIAIAAILVGLAVGFWWYGSGFFGVPSLGELLTGPYCAIPEESRLTLGDSDECRLLATGPFEQFMLRIKVAATAGIILSCPVWLYEMWAFITPGLHRNEKRYGIVFTALAAILFIAGAVMAYFIVTLALEFLLQIGDNVQTTALSGSQYFTFVIQLIIIFGVSFLIPLLLAMLNVVGVLSYAQLAKARRGIIMGIFVFAAIASPGQDPFSMLALALAVCVLVECAIQFARIHDKRKKRGRPEWLEQDDDTASPIGPSGGLDSDTEPVSSSGPVTSSGPLSAAEVDPDTGLTRRSGGIRGSAVRTAPVGVDEKPGPPADGAYDDIT